MATRGRKPKPTALKELEGNPGKRPLNDREPKPEKKAPPCPKWLNDDAKKEWRRLAKKMETLGVLTEVDMSAFAAYCVAYSRWKQTEEEIDRMGQTAYITQTKTGRFPQVDIAQKYFNIMERCAEQFGLTPASRSRLVGEMTQADADSEMEAILRGD